jgi:predicted house-cleaning noncanonical NTP pyrophosphatase (MazG superfamily)
MEKVYNKLVRDNIPEIIIQNNGKPFVRILDDIEYKNELEKKLLEEYNEVLLTKTSEERIEELADMFEIIKALAILENSSIDDVIEVAKSKSIKRGSFENKIYLEKVVEE